MKPRFIILFLALLISSLAAAQSQAPAASATPTVKTPQSSSDKSAPVPTTPSSAPGSATSATTPASTSPAAPAAPAENLSAEALAHKYLDLWNTGDLEAFKAYYTPFLMTTHHHRVVVDWAMLSRVVTTWRKSMPDLTFNVEDTIVQGDKVVMRLTLTGTFKEVLFPMTVKPAAGEAPRKIRSSEVLIFQMKDGKFFNIWEEYDEVVMRVQMGGKWQAPPPTTEESTTSPASSSPAKQSAPEPEPVAVPSNPGSVPPAPAPTAAPPEPH